MARVFCAPFLASSGRTSRPVSQGTTSNQCLCACMPGGWTGFADPSLHRARGDHLPQAHLRVGGCDGRWRGRHACSVPGCCHCCAGACLFLPTLRLPVHSIVAAVVAVFVVCASPLDFIMPPWDDSYSCTSCPIVCLSCACRAPVVRLSCACRAPVFPSPLAGHVPCGGSA